MAKTRLYSKIRNKMWQETLKASPLMDVKWYSQTYHIQQEKAIEHYLEEGYRLGYDPSPEFSSSGYCKLYPDVEQSGYPALVHYIRFGKSENRTIVPSDDPSAPIWNGNSKTGLSLAAYSPESMWNPRSSIEELLAEIMDKDVISFDIFDTLIVRDVIKPTDVFRIMEIDCNEPGFASKRERAEQDCYRKIGVNTTIKDVYREMLGPHGKIDEWVELEFSYELGICRANPYILKLYHEVQKLGKPIIIVSDMYWPEEYLTRLLNAAGYSGWDKLFVSCDNDMTKHAGLLQEKAWEAIGKNKSVIHFGDNYESDVVGSKLMGWDAFWYQNCRDRSNIIINQEQPTVPAGIRAAICSNHLNNGTESFSKEYEHGMLFGGIIVCGYCEYINRIADQMNADAIWFLARDMDVFQKVYRDSYGQYENEYVYASRAAMQHLNIPDYPADYFVRYLRTHSLNGNLKISQVLKENHLNLLNDCLYEGGLNGDMQFDSETYDALYSVFMNHIEDLSNAFSDEIEGAKAYFSELLRKHKKICVADLGWNGTIMVELNRFFKRHFPDAELEYALFGAANAQVTTDLQTAGVLHAFAFSELHDKSLGIDGATIRGNTSIMCLEAMFSADSPSLKSYSVDESGKAVLNFGIKTEKKWMVEDLQKGIIDFASQYNEVVKKLNRHLRISPEDAFRPYASICEDYQYLYLIFGHVKEVEDGSVVSGGTKRMSTIGNIMEKRELL